MPRPLSIAVGLLMIATVLATILWLMWRTLKQTEDPARLIFKWVLTVVFTIGLLAFAAKIGFDNEAAVIIPFVCVLYGIAMSLIWAPNLGSLIARPFTAMFDGGLTPPDPEPLYSIAISKRRMGKFEEAAREIRKQLERFPNDFTGQMMLAELQAEHLNDMPSAQVTIQRLCQQKGHKPAAISAALLQLADWQLKYWQDTDGARESLQKIVTLYPQSELAHVAEQRIAHLAKRDDLMAAHDRPKIHLRVGAQDIGLKSTATALTGRSQPTAPLVEDIDAQAAEYIKHLEQSPLDAEVREQLALIYAANYNRVDYAVSELERILQQPGQTPKQVVRLLNLQADLQIKYAGDYEGAREALQRIIDQYPTLGAAEAAQRRITQLKLELRWKEKPHMVQLGTYEQDLGLKKKLKPKETTPLS